MEEDIDGHFLRFDGFIAWLQDQGPTLPFVTQGNQLGEPSPEPQDLQQWFFGIRMGLDLFRDILRDDLVQVFIGLIDLFYAMMYERDEVNGIFNTDNDPRPELCMLQPGADTQRKLVHIWRF